ncbi:MAG TPA: alpha-amylase family glycosyl hydrolase [Anaerolineales bacterium]|jgi:glycosidase
MSIQPPWADNAFFYHIYPLGFCGAPRHNDHHSPPQPRLEKIYSWIPHMRNLGINALYLGPLFESSTHGYDTADYYHVDHRLGSDETLIQLVRELHANGIRVILDGVFNHVGRDFWAFRDVVQNGQGSRYCDWFQDLHFNTRTPLGDPFTYATWQGHYELVKLNLHHSETRQHLLGAVQSWVRDFEIDGLRLDTADVLDLDFQRELSAFTRTLAPDFWLLGEVIHRDYRYWANPHTLDSVTNYECYKGLYSSLDEKNYFEIAYTLNRQFGEQGLYRALPLYNFVDNHDVDRVANKLHNPALLYPLYCLLFTMPGIPSIYYGSEWGLRAARTRFSDLPLRPDLDLAELQQSSPQPDLPAVIQKLAHIRQHSIALRQGTYCQLFVSHVQLAFLRKSSNEIAIVQLNAADHPANFELPDVFSGHMRFVDVLNGGEDFEVANGSLVNMVNPHWARILQSAV